MNTRTRTVAEFDPEHDEYLCEAIDAIGEQYAELSAQHKSETYAFGDSWPGAQIQIAHLHDALVRTEDELDAYRRRFPTFGPMAVPAQTFTDEEPF